LLKCSQNVFPTAGAKNEHRNSVYVAVGICTFQCCYLEVRAVISSLGSQSRIICVPLVIIFMTRTDISTGETNPKFTGRWPHTGSSALVMGHVQQYAVFHQYSDGCNQYEVTNYYSRLSNSEPQCLSRYSDGLLSGQLDSRRGYRILIYPTSSRLALGPKHGGIFRRS
jgi:hypothetical protein